MSSSTSAARRDDGPEALSIEAMPIVVDCPVCPERRGPQNAATSWPRRCVDSTWELDQACRNDCHEAVSLERRRPRRRDGERARCLGDDAERRSRAAGTSPRTGLASAAGRNAQPARRTLQASGRCRSVGPRQADRRAEIHQRLARGGENSAPVAPACGRRSRRRGGRRRRRRSTRPRRPCTPDAWQLREIVGPAVLRDARAAR